MAFSSSSNRKRGWEPSLSPSRSLSPSPPPSPSLSGRTGRPQEVLDSSDVENTQKRTRRVRKGVFGDKGSSFTGRGAFYKEEDDHDGKSPRSPRLSGISNKSVPEKSTKRNKPLISANRSDADTSSVQRRDEEDTIPATQIDGVKDYLEQDDHDSMVRLADIWKGEINLDLIKKRVDLKDAEKRLEKMKESMDQMKKDLEKTKNRALACEEISARLRKR